MFKFKNSNIQTFKLTIQTRVCVYISIILIVTVAAVSYTIDDIVDVCTIIIYGYTHETIHGLATTTPKRILKCSV